MSLTNSTKNKFVDSLTGRNNALASNVYLGLSSTTPNATGGNVTEPSGNGYARVLIGQSNQSLTYMFDAAANGTATNNNIIYFPEAVGSWGAALTHFVLFTAKTGGTVIGFGELKEDGQAAPITVSTEKTVVMFRKGALSIGYDDGLE